MRSRLGFAARWSCIRPRHKAALLVAAAAAAVAALASPAARSTYKSVRRCELWSHQTSWCMKGQDEYVCSLLWPPPRHRSCTRCTPPPMHPTVRATAACLQGSALHSVPRHGLPHLCLVPGRPGGRARGCGPARGPSLGAGGGAAGGCRRCCPARGPAQPQLSKHRGSAEYGVIQSPEVEAVLRSIDRGHFTDTPEARWRGCRAAGQWQAQPACMHDRWACTPATSPAFSLPTWTRRRASDTQARCAGQGAITAQRRAAGCLPAFVWLHTPPPAHPCACPAPLQPPSARRTCTPTRLSCWPTAASRGQKCWTWAAARGGWVRPSAGGAGL